MAQAHFGGRAIIDVHPCGGFLRMKIKVSPPEKPVEVMASYANVLVTALTMANVQTKVHIARDT